MKRVILDCFTSEASQGCEKIGHVPPSDIRMLLAVRVTIPNVLLLSLAHSLGPREANAYKYITSDT
jgi:hypothetical protein